MAWDLVLHISDIIAMSSIVIAIISGRFAYKKWRREQLLKRAASIGELTEKIRTDKYISRAIHFLDYNLFWYSEDFHGSGEAERMIDWTLTYFSYVCYLNKEDIIRDEEFRFLEYELKRVLLNPGIQDYLYNLYHFARTNGVVFTFQYLYEYGKKHNMFDKDFEDPTAYRTNTKYNKYLNFD